MALDWPLRAWKRSRQSTATHPRLPQARGAVLTALAVAAVLAFLHLDLALADLVPSRGGGEIAARFAARAFAPALSSEAQYVPPGTPPLLVQAFSAAGRTVLFAAAAMGIALLLGLALGFLSSTAWWSGDPAGGRSALAAWFRRTVAPAVYLGARVLSAGLRSVHEILWAIALLSAFGLSSSAAVIAIALPYGGTLAKLFAELVDEAPRDSARALRAAGASGAVVFWLGLVPRALPDLVAYSFYRFECALRSAAVLGLFGFETLGLYLRQSFTSGSYGEVWTYLWVLIAMIGLFDAWSSAIRRRLVAGPRRRSAADTAAMDLTALRRARPRSPFVRASLGMMAALLVGSWIIGDFDLAEFFSPRRAENLQRFLAEIRPWPLHDQPWDWGAAWAWASDLWQRRGAQALAATLSISVLAIALAWAAALLLCLPAARTFAAPEPYAAAGRAPTAMSRLGWRMVVTAARLLLIMLRAVPEYLWAFLLLAVLGPSAWPAVLALALHNAGIMGRLFAETAENAEPRTLATLRGLGASRAQLAAVALWPAALPRFLLYLFYRWETCLREATVLGLLGVVSLGYWIADARTRGQHDVFVFYVLLGALLVLAGDLVSVAVRRLVR